MLPGLQDAIMPKELLKNASFLVLLHQFFNAYSEKFVIIYENKIWFNFNFQDLVAACFFKMPVL